MTLIKILLVDDNENFLKAATGFLASGAGNKTVSTASSGDHALEQVQAMRPDIIFMDISMPGMNGLEATRRIKSMHRPPLVVMLTTHNCIEYRCHATAAGADGFLLKDNFATTVLEMIDVLAERISKSGRVERGRRQRRPSLNRQSAAPVDISRD